MLEYNRRKKYPLTLYRSMATTADIVINFAAVSIALNYPLNSIEFFNKLSSIFYYSDVSKLPPIFISFIADIFSAYHGIRITYCGRAKRDHTTYCHLDVSIRIHTIMMRCNLNPDIDSVYLCMLHERLIFLYSLSMCVLSLKKCDIV